MKNFCLDLREHAPKIINYEKKKRILLTKREKGAHRTSKGCYICKKQFSADDNNKKHHKVRDHCHYTGKYRGAADDICNLRYKIPQEITVVFHNRSTYDYHVIIKELAEVLHNFFSANQKKKKKIRMAIVRLQKYHTK